MNSIRIHSVFTIKNILIITTLLVFSFLAVTCFQMDALQVKPSTGFAFYSYDDSKNSGNSVSQIKVTPEGGVTHLSKLGEKLEYPYCGFTAQLPDLKFFSTSGKILKMDVDSDSVGRLPILIQVFLPGFTNKSIPESFLFLEKMIVLKKGLNHISIPVEQMYVPTWWYTINNITENDLPEFSLDQTAVLAFSNDQFMKAGSSRNITFSNIRIISDYSQTIYTGAVTLAAFCAASGIMYVLKRKKGKHVYIPIKPQEVAEKKDDLLELVKNCLSREYQNPELRVKNVAREIGVSENKVGSVLREQTGMTFSEYINYIRIEEAKRLLQTTNLSISEISSCVGYEYPQNFNRVFRKLTGLTPKEYRVNPR